ncbi:Patched domain-containing protein 3 [Toxocara canis]|uniref:Patched domain-containing protein 3 n=1 Tax=Toxocara canis TaxID=6265 RepID=A0A0B2VMV0_TOXCA|nr:Patched domain-containing protein 3 [Toxocara canis]
MDDSEPGPYELARGQPPYDDVPQSRQRSRTIFRKFEHLVKHGFLLLLQRIFGAIGVFIASFPYLFILVTLCISTISYGVIYVRFAQRLQDGFTSTNSPSRYEEQISLQFRGTNWTYTQRFVALVRAGDGGSMLRPEFFDRALQDSQRMILEAQRANKLPLRNVIIDHPKSTIHEYQYSVAQHLFGVRRRYAIYEPASPDGFSGENDSNPDSQWDQSQRLRLSSSDLFYSNRLEHVTMITLLFYAEAPDANVTNIITHWENAVFDWAKNGAAEFPELSIDVLGDKVLGREMVRGGLSLIPHLLAGLGLSITFVMISVIISSLKSRRVDFGKVLVVIGIIVPPLLAVFTTFGIMGLAHIEIYPIQMVIPFLILAIGVDDAFLMLHAWNRLAPAYDHLNGEERFRMIPTMFGKVLEEVGPSITITSLTNAIAFGIGTTVSTPAIQLFCMAATIAMVMDFIFELTLFGALLSLAARLEQVFSRLLRCYCRLLTMKGVRIFLVTFTSAFFVVSLIGTLKIRTYINAQKIIPSDSRLLRADALFEKYQWKEYEPLQIFVNNPPDIGDPKALAELKSMIRDFETLPHAIGPSATMFWLNDYEKMMKEVNGFTGLFGIEVDDSYNSVPEFLKTFVVWNETIRWHRNADGKVNVTAFYFVTGYCNSTSWWDRAEMMLTWREAASRWQQFNVTIYSENSPVLEGIFGLKGTTVQTATITLVCMLAVCILFLPSAAGILTAGWAICSISLGVFGFLSWWGLDLDPVTMSAIVMSIGFSVDYTAHVSYHYQRARQLLPSSSSKSDRLMHTLDSIGWPMIQAAVSTLVCFLPVAFHPDYTPSVFVRTITLVVGWGLLHGLVLLPAILAAIPDCLFTDLERRISISQPSVRLPEVRLTIENGSLKPAQATPLVSAEQNNSCCSEKQSSLKESEGRSLIASNSSAAMVTPLLTDCAGYDMSCSQK